MDCPIEFRENYMSSDETPSDTDDSEPYEPKPRNIDSNEESTTQNTNTNGSDTQTHRRDDSIVSDTESESDDESDCSTDSEDGNSDDDGEDGGAKVSGNTEDANAPHQAHCIQVILQNGRMINVNAERSNDFDSPMRETNGLHCVIGIINGRGTHLIL